MCYMLMLDCWTQVGALIASVFVGPFSDAYDPQIIFWFCIPLAASIIIPTSLGFLEDERVPVEKRGVDWELLKTNPYLVQPLSSFLFQLSCRLLYFKLPSTLASLISPLSSLLSPLMMIVSAGGVLPDRGSARVREP